MARKSGLRGTDHYRLRGGVMEVREPDGSWKKGERQPPMLRGGRHDWPLLTELFNTIYLKGQLDASRLLKTEAPPEVKKAEDNTPPTCVPQDAYKWTEEGLVYKDAYGMHTIKPAPTCPWREAVLFKKVADTALIHGYVRGWQEHKEAVKCR